MASNHGCKPFINGYDPPVVVTNQGYFSVAEQDDHPYEVAHNELSIWLTTTRQARLRWSKVLLAKNTSANRKKPWLRPRFLPLVIGGAVTY